MVRTTSLQIELSVRVSDGSFETRLSFPVDATKEQRDGIVEMWLKGIRMAVSHRQVEELINDRPEG